jgi:hypothetical protein
MRALALAVLTLMACAINAQTVYKCVDEHGTTEFSPTPCSDDPAKVEAVDTSDSLRTGSGGSIAEQGEMAQLNTVKRQCAARLDGIASNYGAQYARIARETTRLNNAIAEADKDLAGASWESGRRPQLTARATELREQLTGLTTERGTLGAAEANERMAAEGQCAEQLQAEQVRQAKAQKAREAEAVAAAAAAEQAAAAKAAAKAEEEKAEEEKAEEEKAEEEKAD